MDSFMSQKLKGNMNNAGNVLIRDYDFMQNVFHF